MSSRIPSIAGWASEKSVMRSRTTGIGVHQGQGHRVRGILARGAVGAAVQLCSSISVFEDDRPSVDTGGQQRHRRQGDHPRSARWMRVTI